MTPGNSHARGRLASSSPKRRVNVNDWYPYYAGYDPHFVDATLEALHLTPDSVVLDPWCGAGTTLDAASRLGYRAIGFDLSPVANAIATARFTEISEARRKELLCVMDLDPDERPVVARADPLCQWFSRDTTQVMRQVLLRLRHVDPSARSLGLVAVFDVLRAAGGRGSNPTWRKADRIRLGPKSAEHQLGEALRARIEQVQPFAGPRPTVALADSRRLPLPDGSVDAVVASPPYCTRLDYTKATALELAALVASPSRLRSLREQMIGTPLIRPQNGSDWESSCDGVKRLLDRISEHPSFRSRQYYLPTIASYFHDLERSLAEIFRVLRNGASAVIVLQTSYYKEIEIDLPALAIQIGEQCFGFVGDTMASVPVKRVMTTINSRSRKYVSKREYRESAVRLTKPDDGQ